MSHARRLADHELFALLLAAWVWTAPVMAEDPDPSRPAQAPNLPGGAEVAAAATPRQGNGESALIDAAPAPAQAPENAPAPVLSAAPAPAQGAQPAALGTGLRSWTIPPIRWGGYLAADLQRVTAQGQPARTQLVESANLKASSYIWQPWFAQVSGDVTLITAQQRDGERVPGAYGAAGSGSRSTAVTGGGQIALFPVSRFPFTASYSQTDSRASGELTNLPYSSRRWGLTQGYTPPAGGSSYRLAYNRSDLTSEAFGTDEAKALSGGMNWGDGANTLSANGNRYTNTRSNTGDTSSLNTVYTTHSYRPGSTFSVENLANYSDTEYHLTNSGLPTDFRSRFLQLNSFATWRPAEGSPLLVNGGARLFQNSTGVNAATADVTTMSANLGATYALNRNTTLNGAGTVTQVSNGGRGLYTQQTAGIDYASDIVKLGQYSYTWNTGANVGNQTGGESDRRNLGARIGHRVNRTIALGQGSSVFANASQNYSAISDSLVSSSQTLTHSAGASWSRTSGAGATTLLGLDVSDTHTTGYAAQHFQLANLQASGQVQLSRWSSAGANMTVQATRQTASPAFATGAAGPSVGRSAATRNGNLNYQHLRAFGVARLRYYALWNVNQHQDRTRFEGDINAPIERVNWSFEQRLDYDIGRLETRLSVRFAEIEGRTQGLIFFRVLRRFGDF